MKAAKLQVTVTESPTTLDVAQLPDGSRVLLTIATPSGVTAVFLAPDYAKQVAEALAAAASPILQAPTPGRLQ